MTAVQDNYRKVAAGFDRAVKVADAGKWQAPSPCAGWKARDVVAHVVEGHRGVVAQVRGGESKALGAEEDPRTAWEQASAAMTELAGDSEAIAKEINGPTGPMSAGQIIASFVTMDVLVHTWDLARAVGAQETLDQEAVRNAYEALKPMDAMLRQPGVFDPKIDPPAGADLQTEFLCFLGRKV